MTGMDHYAIVDRKQREFMKTLVTMSKTLDKNDFFDTSYFVDERRHPITIAGMSGMTHPKGKGVQFFQNDEEDADALDNEVVDLAGDDGQDDVGDNAFEGSSSLAADAENAEVGGEPVEGSQFRGSSASARERMNVTPCSTRRDPQKRPRQESPVEAQSKTKRLMRMLAQDREDNIRANNKARQENLDFMKSFLRDTVLGLVSVIAKEVFTSMHAASVAPLQMIEPLPSSQ